MVHYLDFVTAWSSYRRRLLQLRFSSRSLCFSPLQTLPLFLLLPPLFEFFFCQTSDQLALFNHNGYRQSISSARRQGSSLGQSQLQAQLHNPANTCSGRSRHYSSRCRRNPNRRPVHRPLRLRLALLQSWPQRRHHCSRASHSWPRV